MACLVRVVEALDDLLEERSEVDRVVDFAEDLSISKVGNGSEDKPHVFVAMPFEPDMEDLFHYGIQAPVRKAGFLCERADRAKFTGDILQWIKSRIQSSAFLVAELTGANPNVYLEVGFAWGLGVPTILLVQDPQDLQFDVQGQRCLVYEQIRDLEKQLFGELRALKLKLGAATDRRPVHSTGPKTPFDQSGEKSGVA